MENTEDWRKKKKTLKTEKIFSKMKKKKILMGQDKQQTSNSKKGVCRWEDRVYKFIQSQHRQRKRKEM